MGPETFLARAVVPAGTLRERLLSFAVHEIRNPLASALWAAEMLARRPLGDSRNDRLAQLGARSLQRLRGLIEDLFALERLPPTLPDGTSDLRQAAERALGPHDLEPTGVTATLDGPPGILVPVHPLYADKLLHALFRRFARAGEGGGSISVTVREEHSGGVLEVFRADSPESVVDPPMLAPGGSEGAGTTFTMLFVRALALRAGLDLAIVPHEGGTLARLRFHR